MTVTQRWGLTIPLAGVPLMSPNAAIAHPHTTIETTIARP